jgi:hypothetical protein
MSHVGCKSKTDALWLGEHELNPLANRVHHRSSCAAELSSKKKKKADATGVPSLELATLRPTALYRG